MFSNAAERITLLRNVTGPIFTGVKILDSIAIYR